MASGMREPEIVADVKPFTPRPLWARLDVLPFGFVYVSLLIGLFVYVNEEFESFVLSFALLTAVLLHALVGLSQIWSVAFFAFITGSPVPMSRIFDAKFVAVTPTEHNGKAEICKLCFETNNGLNEINFTFQRLKYIFDAESGTFARPAYPIAKPLSAYRYSSGLDEVKVAALRKSFGPNRLDIPVPSFGQLMKDQMIAPLFVFQVFCVGLWCLDEYWYYSVFTLGMLVMFESTIAASRLKTLKEFRGMPPLSFDVSVYRRGKWVVISSVDLVPGDIVSVVRNKEGYVAPADMLMLAGSVVVDESLLTGESVPQLKEATDATSLDDVLNIAKEHKSNVVFGGTTIMNHTAPALDAMKNNPFCESSSSEMPRDGGAIAIVLRTGFGTAQGSLMRTMLFASERVTANSKDAYLFLGCLLVFAVAASAYVLKKGLQDDDRDKWKLVLKCVIIITSVVPPELPMELSLAVNNSLIFLAKLSIFCTEPFRIPSAGKVSVCCFDKTGTLTEDDFDVKGIVQTMDGEKPDLSAPHGVQLDSLLALSGCHSLMRIDKKVVGDPLEKAALSFLGVSLTSPDVCLSTQGDTVKILKRFPFSSSLQRMTCIMEHSQKGSMQGRYVVMKGAPEKLKDFLGEIPPRYDEMYKFYTRRGARVLALAVKRCLKDIKTSDLKAMTRDELEDSVKFAGFAIFESPIKKDSAATVSQLQSSSHTVIMITGDQALTAAHVAQEVGILERPPLFLVAEKDTLWWETLEEKKISFKETRDEIKKLSAEYNFVLPGNALPLLEGSLLEAIIVDCDTRVLARVGPDQKEDVVQLFRKKGFHTMMCGDGTNDVGALKQADVGIALIEGKDLGAVPPPQPKSFGEIWKEAQEKARNQHNMQIAAKEKGKKLPSRNNLDALAEAMEEVPMVRLGDASVAAPFTSKVPSVRSTIDIIRQGRCTLVTTQQMFKILGLNSLISAYSLSVLALEGVKFGDIQMTVSGFGIALFFSLYFEGQAS
uniref:Cation-transporting ATPase n=1 Tax=Palpitomonas bilix TaxID=652834 RepID=A0A7S3LWG7_9EUKA